MLQITDGYSNDIVRLDGSMREITRKWDGIEVRISGVETGLQDRLDRERDEMNDREEMRDDTIKRLQGQINVLPEIRKECDVMQRKLNALEKVSKNLQEVQYFVRKGLPSLMHF